MAQLSASARRHWPDKPSSPSTSLTVSPHLWYCRQAPVKTLNSQNKPGSATERPP
jgi:hypothetical protein